MRPDRSLRVARRTRRRIAQEIDTELELHLEARAAELAAAGMHPDDARREAEREFGDLEYTRRYCLDLDARAERSMRVKEFAGELRQDIVYAARTLRRSPGFAAVALLTLALAIGVNSAIFSVAGAVLLQPLPYRDPGQLVALYEDHTPSHTPKSDMSAADLTDYRSMQKTLTGIAILTRAGQITYHPVDGDPVVLKGMRVSANMFEVLGVGALYGRTFTADEDTPAKKNVLLLSYDLWRRLFNGDPAAVGKRMLISDRAFEIIGVMPRGFGLGYGEELWIPLDLSGVMADVNRSRKMHFMFGLARVRTGVSVEAARADLISDAKVLESKYPDANTGHYVTVVPLHTAMVGDVRSGLLLLSAAAGLVLLIACANLANVTLARAITRRQEMAVRAAIGAGRARLARQLLTESVLLAIVGGAVGIVVAYLGTQALLALNPSVLPPLAHVSIDGRVLGFSVGVSVLTGILCGLAPALDGARADLHAALKDAGRSASHGAGGERLRRSLVVAQIALAAVLLAGAGLLVRSFAELQRVQMGFDPAHVLTAEMGIGGARYDSVAQFNRFWATVRENVSASPGIVSVGFTGSLPTTGTPTSSLVIAGQPFDPNRLPEVGYVSIAGDYFKAMAIPLRAGRFFDETDLPKGPRVVIVNESFTRKFFPGGDALGQRIHLGPDPQSPEETIVGVVGDVRQGGLELEPRPQVYVDNRQEQWSYLIVVVRGTGDAAAATSILRRSVHEIDPAVALSDVRSMEDVVGSTLAARKFSLVLICAFAGLALALAAVGVYGVLAYTVATRRREFGIRLALGATGASVLRLVLTQGFAWLALGLGIGITASLAGGKLIESMLYGVQATDALTFSAVAIVLLAVVVLACVIPARRATRVDPVAAMRTE